MRFAPLKLVFRIKRLKVRTGPSCYWYSYDRTTGRHWDHTVLPATRHKWTRLALTPAHRRVLDLPTPKNGRLSRSPQQWNGRESNWRPLDHKSDALTTTLLSRPVFCCSLRKKMGVFPLSLPSPLQVPLSFPLPHSLPSFTSFSHFFIPLKFYPWSS